MEFLGISFWEFLLIVVVILVVLGPSRIPGIMRTLGTIVRKIRKITSELTASVAREIALDEARKETEKRSSLPPQDKPARKTPPKAPRDSLPAGRSTHDEQ